MKTLYVIPVPGGMRWEDAFEEMQTFGELQDGREVSDDGVGGCWYVIEEDEEA